MGQIAYTPIGGFTKQIDFWDQPTDPNTDGSKPDPVVFVTGVYAQIEGLWATTQAVKLGQQVVTEVTHRVTIRYMPGLRSRMFILYNDPDTPNPRRFDIDKIIDPDEKKVELRLNCIERNDGQ